MPLSDADRQIACAKASEAVHCGDLARAERWLRLIERDILIEERETRPAREALAVEAARQRIADADRRMENEAAARATAREKFAAKFGR